NMTTHTLDGLTRRLLDRVRLVRHDLGADEVVPDDAQVRLADLLDSMAMVEFLLVVAGDCGATPEAIEACVGRQFGTVAGLAAALHHRLELRPTATALEVGGACTGFLAALWLARMMLPSTGNVLIVSVEAPTGHLLLRPGPAGEAAALFGDAAAACLVCAH